MEALYSQVRWGFESEKEGPVGTIVSDSNTPPSPNPNEPSTSVSTPSPTPNKFVTSIRNRLSRSEKGRTEWEQSYGSH